MAVLETIRVKFGIIITLVIAVALLSFIIDPTTLQSVLSSNPEESSVGIINDEPVKYTEFVNEVDKITTVTEIMSGSSASSEEQQKAIRDDAWRTVLNNRLFIPNAENAGIKVGEEELDLVLSGNIPSTVITQNPLFFDQNGVFSQDYVLQFIELANSQPMYMNVWEYLVSEARIQQYYSKYMSLLTNARYLNSLMLKDQLSGNNNTFDVDFIMLPLGYQKDSSIVVSDSEIKNYYNSHKKFYKQKASRDIEYVSFSAEPSVDDINEISDEMSHAYDEFVSTDDMSAFLNRNSDRKYDEHWYKSGELKSISSDVNDFVDANSSGVSKVIKDGDAFYAARIMKKAMVPDSVYVKYINVSAPDSLFDDVEPQWLAQVDGFEKLMTTPKGASVELNGYKFKVIDRSKLVSKKQVAILKKDITPSQETIDEYYTQATDFHSKAKGGYDNFKTVVNEQGLYAHSVNKMLEGTDRLGSIDNTKPVTRWAFDSGKGKVSDVITLNGTDFVVATVKNVHNEGYTPIAEVRDQIYNILYNEKLSEKKLAEVKEQINGVESLKTIAKMFDTEVSSNDGLSFHSSTTYGMDPKFVGAASDSEVGVIKAIAGNYGIYVFNVTAKNQGSSFTEDDLRLSNSQKSQYSLQMILPEMMESANVKDYRERYF